MDSLGSQYKIDIFYRPSAKQIIFKNVSDKVIDGTIKHMSKVYGDQQLLNFVNWAVENNKLDSPKFPEVPTEKVYSYYRNMVEGFSSTYSSYKDSIPQLLQEYKALHSTNDPIKQLNIIVPDKPEDSWLHIMEPTSIAMGSLMCGKAESFSRLSPAGIVWRSDAVRGLIDSLKNVEQNKEFSVYSMLRPQALTHYFMKCHPHAYFEGKIAFNELTPSDVTLIARSAFVGYKDGVDEILTRGLQLMRKSISQPQWGTWLKNIAVECANALENLGCAIIDHPDPDDLDHSQMDILNKIIDGKMNITAEIKKQLCRCR